MFVSLGNCSHAMTMFGGARTLDLARFCLQSNGTSWCPIAVSPFLPFNLGEFRFKLLLPIWTL
jgi:hypothetical protein